MPKPSAVILILALLVALCATQVHALSGDGGSLVVNNGKVFFSSGSTNGIPYLSAANQTSILAAGGAGTLCLQETAGGVPFWAACASSAGGWTEANNTTYTGDAVRTILDGTILGGARYPFSFALLSAVKPLMWMGTLGRSEYQGIRVRLNGSSVMLNDFYNSNPEIRCSYKVTTQGITDNPQVRAFPILRTYGQTLAVGNRVLPDPSCPLGGFYYGVTGASGGTCGTGCGNAGAACTGLGTCTTCPGTLFLTNLDTCNCVTGTSLISNTTSWCKGGSRDFLTCTTDDQNAVTGCPGTSGAGVCLPCWNNAASVNGSCTAAATPYPCCTGSGTGNCALTGCHMSDGTCQYTTTAFDNTTGLVITDGSAGFTQNSSDAGHSAPNVAIGGVGLGDNYSTYFVGDNVISTMAFRSAYGWDLSRFNPAFGQDWAIKFMGGGGVEVPGEVPLVNIRTQNGSALSVRLGPWNSAGQDANNSMNRISDGQGRTPQAPPTVTLSTGGSTPTATTICIAQAWKSRVTGGVGPAGPSTCVTTTPTLNKLTLTPQVIGTMINTPWGNPLVVFTIDNANWMEYLSTVDGLTDTVTILDFRAAGEAPPLDELQNTGDPIFDVYGPPGNGRHTTAWSANTAVGVSTGSIFLPTNPWAARPQLPFAYVVNAVGCDSTCKNCAGWDYNGGLTSQCTAAQTPFGCCTGANAGICSGHTGKYEPGTANTSTSWHSDASLFCDAECTSSSDCSGGTPTCTNGMCTSGSSGTGNANADCTASGVPFACCTGSNTGNCRTQYVRLHIIGSTTAKAANTQVYDANSADDIVYRTNTSGYLPLSRSYLGRPDFLCNSETQPTCDATNGPKIQGLQWMTCGSGATADLWQTCDYNGSSYAWTTLVDGLANPTALVGLTAVNGVALTAMRSDAAPAIDQTIAPTWTGLHTFQQSALGVTLTDAVQLVNPTLSTAGVPVQASPTLRFSGRGWNTGSVADNPMNFREVLMPVSGNPASSLLEWFAAVNVGGYTKVSSISSGGIFDVLSGYTVGNAGTTGHYLRGNGTSYVDGTIQTSDLPMITTTAMNSYAQANLGGL